MLSMAFANMAGVYDEALSKRPTEKLYFYTMAEAVACSGHMAESMGFFFHGELPF